MKKTYINPYVHILLFTDVDEVLTNSTNAAAQADKQMKQDGVMRNVTVTVKMLDVITR